MGGVLMDFHAGLELIGDELRKDYAGRYNEVPNIISYLPPIKGAVEAMDALRKRAYMMCIFFPPLHGVINPHGQTR